MSQVFEIIRRDDTDLQLTFTDVDGNPIDLTGGTVYLTVKTRPSDSDDDAVLAKELTEFDTPETGVCIIQIASDEADIAPGNYFYDVQLKLNDNIASAKKGIIRVLSDITQKTD